MKRILLFAFIAMTLMVKAQTITIGEGTEMTTQVPFNTFYNYSFTEQIYLSSEIQYAGYLKAISFRIAYSYNSEAVADIDVYVKNVSRNGFADAADFEPVTDEDRVFSGLWTIPANVDDWMTITFDTPFYYNGIDNLMIAIDENSDDYAMRYFKYSEVNGLTLSYCSDSDNPNPTDLASFGGSKEVINRRANTKLVFDYTYGVEENNAEVLTVYPNPVSEVLHIDGAEGKTVSVFDATGRRVMQEVCSGRLDVSNLPKGGYIVTMGKKTVKFVKE